MVRFGLVDHLLRHTVRFRPCPDALSILDPLDEADCVSS